MTRLTAFSALLATSALVATLQANGGAQPPARNSGVSDRCGTFSIDLDLFLGSVTLYELDDEGWAYVDPARKIRAVTGVAEGVNVAAIDSPSNHDSHDLDFHLVVDPGQDDVLSVQTSDYIGVEWETGIRPDEKHGDGAAPTFPKWMWPADGDRVWAEGNWVFDCGHPVNGLFKTEIHPPRAFASMRDQAAPLPGTGLTPVPVTRTDLYIHGRGGFGVQQLNCGTGIIFDDNPDNCGQSSPPADQSYKTTPIAADYTFDVCLPPRPAHAVFSHDVQDGPRNSVSVAPVVTLTPAAGACATAPGFDHTTMMRVTVPLAGTGTPPTAVYARHILAGWVAAPPTPLAQRRVTVRSTNLTEDHDLDPGAGELSFWWVNVNRAATGWLRLSDFATGNMNDYDDETGFGDGEMQFSQASVDFYLREGQDITVRSRGYEQDCYDAFGGFNHRFNLLLYGICAVDVQNQGSSDELSKGNLTLAADAAGPVTMQASDFDMRLALDHLPLGLEDTAYLSTGVACAPTGEVALVGEPLTCTTRVDNAGPGLPRDVVARTTIDPGPATAAVTAASWTVRAPWGTGPHACDTFGADVFCRNVIPPVVAAAPAVATVTATPTAPGRLTVRASVSTTSTDPQATDDAAVTTVEVFLPVALDVLPGDPANVLNLNRRTVTVAVRSTAAFDATTIDPASVCFGDPDTPAARACGDTHGRGHLEDVDRDGRRDLLLHVDTAATGLDLTDTRACLTGRTALGLGVYGCDAVVVK
jgi:hypothetical protein